MNNQYSVETLAQKAEALRALHAGPGMLVLTNVWDAGSARVVAAAGFPAIATTSGGVARSLGYEDHQNAPVAEMTAAAARVSRAVNVPVTVDFEAGYGLEPEEIVRHLLAAGAAGLNFEDTDHVARGLVDAAIQAGRIAAIREAARAAGVNLVINARVDVFIQHQGTLQEQVDEGLRRARLYREAGADCIYPILLDDETAIRQFVREVGVINVNLRRGGPLSLQRAADLGVRRVSYAVSLYRETVTSLERLAGEIYGEARALTPP
jgi:2-methylisocitrate lyase-like PEP mutase family enzyme